MDEINKFEDDDELILTDDRSKPLIHESLIDKSQKFSEMSKQAIDNIKNAIVETDDMRSRNI